MIGLLKMSWPICQSGKREIGTHFLWLVESSGGQVVAHNKDILSVRRRYQPGLEYFFDAGPKWFNLRSGGSSSFFPWLLIRYGSKYWNIYAYACLFFAMCYLNTLVFCDFRNPLNRVVYLPRHPILSLSFTMRQEVQPYPMPLNRSWNLCSRIKWALQGCRVLPWVLAWGQDCLGLVSDRLFSLNFTYTNLNYSQRVKD